MRKIGNYLLIFGLGSMFLYFLDMEFFVMMWVDHWGEGFGWMIRTTMVVAGLICIVNGGESESAFD